MTTHRHFLASIWHGFKDKDTLVCHCGTTHVVPDCHVSGGPHAKRGKR